MAGASRRRTPRSAASSVTVARRDFRLELADERDRPGSGQRRACARLPGRAELEELLLERLRETPAPQVPAVELLQEPRRPALAAELAHRLADEEHELRGHLFARWLTGVAVDDLPQRPRIALRAPTDHHQPRRRSSPARPGRARARSSPDATTGTSTSETSSAVSAWSAVPVYICSADLVERERLRAGVHEPGPGDRGTPETRCGLLPQLQRHRQVDCVRDRLRRSDTRDRHPRGGAPLRPSASPSSPGSRTRSTRSAPTASTMRAASAIGRGSEPKSWIASGARPRRRGGSRASARSGARSLRS